MCSVQYPYLRDLRLEVKKWIPQYGTAVVSLHVQTVNKEICRSVNSTLPKRHCQ